MYLPLLLLLLTGILQESYEYSRGKKVLLGPRQVSYIEEDF